MEIVFSTQAPAAVGPFSQAIKSNGMLYLSGQLPLDPETMKFSASNVTGQAEQIFRNISSVITEAGCEKESIVKTTVFLSDMNNFTEFNAAYSEFFGEHKPARSCVEVARLPLDALVEIELIAEL
ncbi:MULTISPECIES: RidA family protein [Vibrio]|uniref:RidA family protein n=1 Tax=Vibrio TaxID=662 RepID=UPI00237C89A0|nr:MULTISPECIES: RidA family protein [Vibrio]MDE1231223.1 RidA family protein [Vibrio aestuarianus]MDF9401152.1 RidA family protein [Vibrio sp. 1180_3]